QNDDDGHDTEERYVESTLDGFDQAEPFHSSALPALSTAMQNDDDGHDTEERYVESTLDGFDQAEPFHSSALPALSTAMQNDGDGHDTEEMPAPGSTCSGVVQLYPWK
ncbi:MAG: hypothetical protein M1420_01070, partial [Actinobacteria bacterium]|nr:hypothetical protein [Actinomycetota bacterium]